MSSFGSWTKSTINQLRALSHIFELIQKQPTLLNQNNPHGKTHHI